MSSIVLELQKDLPRFAYSVIVLTISAAATYPANCGKTGQTNANQEDFKI